MLLGIYSDPELVDQRLELLPGDALVLFTDGLQNGATLMTMPRPRIEAAAPAPAPAQARRRPPWPAGSERWRRPTMTWRWSSCAGSTSGNHRHSDRAGAERIHSGRVGARSGVPGRRQAALAPLVGALATQVYSDMRLLVSELVTNSVRHAGFCRVTAFGFRSSSQSACFASR